MFTYPFSVPKNTTYDELGLTPEATAEDVREAKWRLQIEVTTKKSSVEKALDEVFAQVSGLRDACNEEQRVKNSHDPEELKKLTEIQGRISARLPKALAVNPDFRRLQEQQEELKRRMGEINLISLDNPEKRGEHDAFHPPLGLLRYTDSAQDGFLDNKTALFLIRSELGGFFSDKGEEVFHPSDITRTDFPMDFTENEELDE